MKKVRNQTIILLLLLSVVTSVFSPVWCFESNGNVILEWNANCIPDGDCHDCFDVQASATDNSVAQNVFVLVSTPLLPVQKLWEVNLLPLQNGININESDHLFQTQFLGKDTVILLI